MARQALAAVVLAAGRGERMRSSMPKALHEVAGRANGRPCGRYAGRVLRRSGSSALTGPAWTRWPRRPRRRRRSCRRSSSAPAHAVMAARGALGGFEGAVLVLCRGHSRFIRAETMPGACRCGGRRGGRRRAGDAPPPAPTNTGGWSLDGAGRPEAVVEWRDAGPEAQALPVCNAGVMAVDGRRLFPLLDRVGNDNARGEFYLTDIVALARGGRVWGPRWSRCGRKRRSASTRAPSSPAPRPSCSAG